MKIIGSGSIILTAQVGEKYRGDYLNYRESEIVGELIGSSKGLVDWRLGLIITF